MKFCIESLINQKKVLIMSSFESELIALRNDMESNQLAPVQNIIANGQTQEYEINIKGIFKRAIYTAVPYPFDNDRDSPLLLCSYGPIDKEGGQYIYSSLKEK